MPNNSITRQRRKRRAYIDRPLVSATDLTSGLGNKVYRMRLPATPVMLSTTATTGVIAYEGQISPPSQVSGWSTRFGSTFDEYRVIAADIELHAVGIYAGQTAFFISELALGTPTNLEASERQVKLLNNNNQVWRRSTNVIHWRATDTNDIQFQTITAGFNGMHYYVYTDNANFGAPTSVTQLWIVRPYLTIEFRGIRST